MRLNDLESPLTLNEENLTQQQISNLFASVELVVTRDPLGTNRTLLGRGLDRLRPRDQMQTAVKNAVDHLKKQVGFSTADPTVGPKIDSIEKEIITKISNDPIITQKLQQYKTMMLNTPKLQKFMIDLFNSINDLVDGGIDRDPLVDFFNQIDQEIINKIPAQMGSSASAQAGSTISPQGSSPVTEGIFDLNKIDRKKIISAWVNAGRPTDSNKILNILKNMKVGEDQLQLAYKLAKIPYPETTTSSVSAQARRPSTPSTAGARSTGPTTPAASTTQTASPKTGSFKNADAAKAQFDQFFSKISQMSSKNQTQVINHIKNQIETTRPN